MTNPLKDMSAKIMAAAIAAGLVILLVLFAFHMWKKAHTAAAEERLQRGQAEAAISAGAEAMNTVSNVAASAKADDQIHEEGINAIRNAPEGKSGDAALDASCRLRINQHKQRCAGLPATGPGDAARARDGHRP